jgi:predicted DCC family thiol-disulfide oxidoreductase YuxK
MTKFKQIFAFDLRSLALFRMGLAVMVMADIISRASAGGLVAHYTDAGLLPRKVLIEQLLHPWYWSLHLISGEPFVQTLLFVLAFAFALALLFGYHTRLAIIATWVFNISIQNRNPALIFAGDDVLRAILFWSMFLPLGANYSVDSALNSASKPLPKVVASGATFALMVQVCFIYIWSAAYKTKSGIWWPDGDAVYYSLSFDQYVTGFGQWLLGFPRPFLRVLTFAALGFEWVGPLMIFIPFYNSFFRIVAVISFILLHLGFELCFQIGVLSFLSMFIWSAFIPSLVWDGVAQRWATPERRGLQIYYDADCGFCKKVVHLIRTFLILPGTPLLPAQDDTSIYEDMVTKNSWVVVDWQGKRHFKFAAIAYVFSLSPIFFFLTPLLRWQPIATVGRKFYETIANNRRLAGKFTKPLTFRPLQIKPSLPLNIVAILLIFLITIWNLTSFVDQTVARRPVQPNDWVSSAHQFLHRKTFNQLASLGYLTRLDQSWSIFAPAPPRDDGWHVIIGKLKDGSEVNVLEESRPISWEKPTVQQRKQLYQTIQWRVYFINLNRAIGSRLYPHFANYLCHNWQAKHQGSKQLESFAIYFINERTVPPSQTQQTNKKLVWQQSCLEQQSN